jgi:hypothetical protein
MTVSLEIFFKKKTFKVVKAFMVYSITYFHFFIPNFLSCHLLLLCGMPSFRG